MALERWSFPEPHSDLRGQNDPAEGQGQLKTIRRKEFNKFINNQEQQHREILQYRKESQNKQERKMMMYALRPQ